MMKKSSKSSRTFFTSLQLFTVILMMPRPEVFCSENQRTNHIIDCRQASPWIDLQGAHHIGAPSKIESGDIGTSSAAYFGYYFDWEHAGDCYEVKPAVSLITVYGKPSNEAPGPSPVWSEEFYEINIDNGSIPLIRLEELWWFARGMYMGLDPEEKVYIAVGDQLENMAAPLLTEDSYEWTSSDPGVVYVDDAGMATGIAPGVCRLTAIDSSSGDSGESVEIEVKNVAALVKKEVLKGMTYTFLAVGQNEPLVWQSDDPGRGSIDEESGIFTAHAAGSVTIRVTDSQGYMDQHTIKILDFLISPRTPARWDDLAVGEEVQLTLEGEYEGETEWKYDDTILTFDEESLSYTAAAPGTTYLYLSASDIRISNILTIRVREVAISNPWNLHTIPGEELRFNARRPGANEFEWISTNPAVGTVSDEGIFTSLSPGVCRIKAKTGDWESFSDPITVHEVLIMSEHWTFFDLWVQEWAKYFPEAWFQYGNEIGGQGDPLLTSYSSLYDGFTEANRHVYENIKSISPDIPLIAQSNADPDAFLELLDRGISQWIDAYSTNGFFCSVDLRQMGLFPEQAQQGTDPDAWFEFLMNSPGVDPDKDWILTDVTIEGNYQSVRTPLSMPTALGYLKDFISSNGKKFNALIWYSMDYLIHPRVEQDRDWEGYHHYKTMLQRIHEPDSRAQYPIDISTYFDGDGISYESNYTDGDFDGSGKTYSAELMPESGSVAYTTLDGVPWLMPDKNDSALNYLSCSGQVIEFPTGRYGEVHLIGAGTGGSIPAPDIPRGEIGLSEEGEFIFRYQDGLKQTEMISMSNWYSGGVHGEWPALTMRHFHTASGPAYEYDFQNNLLYDNPAFIWDYTIFTDGSRVLESITLPLNSNMKILGLTLTSAPEPGLSVEVISNYPEYSSGDEFCIELFIDNQGPKTNVAKYIALEVHGQFWFWPDWNQTGDEPGSIEQIPSNSRLQSTVISFEWPEDSGSEQGLFFWAGLFHPQEISLIDYDVCSFDYH